MSKTPKVKDAKTVLERKYTRVIGTLVAILLVAGLIGITNRSSLPTLRANGQSYHLEVATTTVAQQTGLSGRTNLPADQGMLFSYSDDEVRCFWMKDMHFPLDIIWLNSHKQVIYIESNVNPSTYPTKFCPSIPAQDVIELNAGQVHLAGIATGQTLNY